MGLGNILKKAMDVAGDWHPFGIGKPPVGKLMQDEHFFSRWEQTAGHGAKQVLYPVKDPKELMGKSLYTQEKAIPGQEMNPHARRYIYHEAGNVRDTGYGNLIGMDKRGYDKPRAVNFGAQRAHALSLMEQEKGHINKHYSRYAREPVQWRSAIKRGPGALGIPMKSPEQLARERGHVL